MRESFGHYTLLGRLAVGGMAEIFAAQHAYAAPGEPCVVVKRILPHLSDDPAFVRMFIDEARLAVGLIHPNVVRTVDFGCMGARHYLTMTHVQGIDLYRLLNFCLQQRRALGILASCALGLGLARALTYTHRFVSADGVDQQVVHRDVSPHNVMVSHAGEPVLMDFGIAKAALRSTRTATDAGHGTIKGKLAYMAPEQARGEPATQRSDQYALGVLLWECLAGRRLFAATAGRPGLVPRLSAARAAPDICQVAPTVPRPLANLVMRALAANAEDRFASVAALGQALETFLATQGSRAAAQAALAEEVAGYQRHAQQTGPDWCYQGDFGAGHTPAAAQVPPREGTLVLAAGSGLARGGPIRTFQHPRGRPAHAARRPSGGRATPAFSNTLWARRTPWPRELRAAGPRWRPSAGAGRSRHSWQAWGRAANLRARLWWAFYAAACGAAGHALWPRLAALGGAQAAANLCGVP